MEKKQKTNFMVIKGKEFIEAYGLEKAKKGKQYALTVTKRTKDTVELNLIEN
jgi:hypothetical protein